MPRAVRDRSSDLERLADLLVGFGANLQPGQILGVTAYLGMEDAARAVARAGYRRGAKYVDVFWWDQLVKRARLELADDDTLDFVPPWIEQRMRVALRRASGAGDADRSERRRLRRDRSGANGPRSAPVHRGGAEDRQRADDELDGRARARTIGWAQRVHPELEPDGGARQALGRDRPRLPARRGRSRRGLAGADEGDRRQRRPADASAASTRSHLRGPGTDLTIGLMPSSKWLGADFATADGLTHYPNLPTEEVFTTPDPERVDGHVSATMPLELYGSYIERDPDRVRGRPGGQGRRRRGRGCAPRDRRKGRGAVRLGEIALVDKEGRIGPLRTVFYETLLDENAASHIALGNAYTFPLEDEADRMRANAATSTSTS